MEDRKFEIISQLMDELKGLMEPSQDDLGERLGRPKVEVEIEGEDAMDGGDVAMDGDMMENPEDQFKQRLMKLRG